MCYLSLNYVLFLLFTLNSWQEGDPAGPLATLRYLQPTRPQSRSFHTNPQKKAKQSLEVEKHDICLMVFLWVDFEKQH